MHTWELWYPAAAATGLPFTRARIDPADVVLVHAAPDVLRAEVRDDAGVRVAFADGLKRSVDYVPMTRLWVEGRDIRREDTWPDERDVGRVVLLAGGEAGVLCGWWHAGDQREWRWQVEFYNRR